MTTLKLVLFGSPGLERDQEPVLLDTRKAIALLAYLAVMRGRHTRDHLAGLLWPEYEQTNARASLRRTLSVLHQALAEAELDIDRESLGLRSDSSLRVDVHEFQRQLASCLSHGHAAGQLCADCLEPLTAAVALYRGDFMAGFALRDSPPFDDWQYLQQESLRRDMVSALERLAEGYSLEHEFETAIKYTRRWLELDRLHETAHRQLMLLYTWTGNRSAALHQYRVCVRTLEEELGVAPLEATTSLYEAIKESRTPPPPQEKLATSGSTSGAASEPLARTASLPTRLASLPPSRESAPGPASPEAQAPEGQRGNVAVGQLLSPSTYPLVERGAEWSALEDAYRRLTDPSARRSGHILLLEGEAGIGKTRLAEEFSAHVRELGAQVLSARCYEGEANLAYRPIISALRAALADPVERHWIDQLPAHWLSESARLVPEVAERRPGLAPPPPLESPGAQSHFFEGLARTLAAACSGVDPASQRPGVLFLDDIQWADRATLDLLTYMARRLGEYPLCLLFTWRNVEVPNSPRHNRLVAESERTGHATVLSLSRLTLAGIRELAASQTGPGTPPAEAEKIAERLYQETEGLPLFLVEYLAAVAGEVRSGAAPQWSLPGGIRELLHLRLQMVGESSWQILTTAAVIGRSFDFATLWEASGRSEEEAVAALEDLVSQGLVLEVSRASDNEPAYDFTHEKLRALVYEETSLARRRLLHRRVAESLAGRTHRNRQPRSLPGQIARHFLQAGAESKAAEYFKVAGELARAVYANTEALEHFSTALALGHPDAAGLHEAIGDLYTFLGTYGAALKSYETAAALSPAEKLAIIEQKLGGVYLRRGDWELAESHFQAALESLELLEPLESLGTHTDEEKPTGSDGQKARIYADWSLAARNRGQVDRALKLAETALQLAELAHDTQAEAQVHNMLGILATGQGSLDEAVRQLEESLALAVGVPDRGSARAAALNNLALALGTIGDVERAISLAEEALELCIAQGDRHREAALHNNLADLLHVAGRSPEAMAHIKESVSIYAEIGVEAGTVQPQIWKLAEW